MSFNLYFYPDPQPQKKTLCKGLKYVISPRMWGHDGTLPGGPIQVGSETISFLNGIIEATGNQDVREAAKELISAIIQHGTVVLEISD